MLNLIRIKWNYLAHVASALLEMSRVVLDETIFEPQG